MLAYRFVLGFNAYKLFLQVSILQPTDLLHGFCAEKQKKSLWLNLMKIDDMIQINAAHGLSKKDLCCQIFGMLSSV